MYQSVPAESRQSPTERSGVGRWAGVVRRGVRCLRASLRHRAAALESDTFVQVQLGGLDIAMDLSRRVQLDETLCAHLAPDRAAAHDQGLDLDVGMDLGGGAEDEQASAGDVPG